MAATFKLSVVSPEKTIFEGTVASVTAPAYDGYVGILAGHEPMIAALGTGVLEFEDDNEQRRFVMLDGGFIEVSHGSAIVLADKAELAQEIDLETAMQDLEAARRALRGEASDMTSAEATKEIDRAMHRVRAARMSK
jgi:F-type H+-transporting ATPase subunit epsilon